MKKKSFLFILLMLTLLLTACGQSATSDTSLIVPGEDQGSQLQEDADPQYTIALVMKTLTNPFFIEMEKGAREAEMEFGINLIVKTGAQETSIDQQITIIEELITQDVDAILIAPADSVQLIPVLKRAQDAGIIIVNIDNQLDAKASEQAGLVDVPFISVDNEQGAYLSAQYLSQNISEPTQAIIIEGIVTAQNGQDRKNGAMRAFDENPNIEVVASQSANWKIDEAHDVAAELFIKYPDVKLVFCANDMMAFGVIQYLQENGMSDVKVAAYDALAEAMPYLKNGSLQATIDQRAAVQAYTGVQYAIQSLEGQEMTPVTLLPVLLVTGENAK